jgi:hypothetical protein
MVDISILNHIKKVYSELYFNNDFIVMRLRIQFCFITLCLIFIYEVLLT